MIGLLAVLDGEPIAAIPKETITKTTTMTTKRVLSVEDFLEALGLSSLALAAVAPVLLEGGAILVLFCLQEQQ